MSTTTEGGPEDVAGHLSAPRGARALRGPVAGRSLPAPRSDGRAATTTVVRAPARLLAGAGALLVVDVTGGAISGRGPSGRVRAVLDSGLEAGAEIAVAGLDAGGRALLTVALPRGEHVLRVSYDGDGDHAPSSAAPRLLRVVAHPTVVTVDALPPEPDVGTVLLAAQVRSDETAPGPSGTVVFLDGGHELGTAAVDRDGAAVLRAPSLDTGVHRIVAAYSGDLAHAAARSSAMPHAVHVRRVPTVLVVEVSDSAGHGGHDVPVTVRVVAGDGSVTGATGEVVLAGAGGSPVRLALHDGTASAVLPAAMTGAGLTATYSGDAEHAACTAP